MCTSSSLFLLYQEITGSSRVCRTTELWRDQRSGSKSAGTGGHGPNSQVSLHPSPKTSVRIVTQTETDRERKCNVQHYIYTTAKLYLKFKTSPKR